ncbi:adenosylcobinamide-phosphate synthase CbiB [Roseisalinus antarcticus]|uniref:Cobalamin biosynthesis protein CobD n=1 Tax=Roseisalinus antarcticus TaxID=254357 RepID=A0A1Y5SN34_9RHOB|nr:adenosylcobinamide-phosphate synthase CbiB [Roseisalinus antarcticus]SLN44549.1 cobalamin biosynthesis protein [Roseisalinus antarcticus]
MTTALVVALLLDALLGEPRWLWTRLPHPAVLAGRAVGALDRQLNQGRNRRAKGVLALTFLLAAALALGAALAALPGQLAEIVVTAILLAQRSLSDHVRQVANTLRLSLPDGRASVAMIVGRDTAAMDEAAVARAAIESAAENLSDGVTAPAFWFLLGGLPALVAYKAVNTADSMIGHRTPRHAAFGWASARLDDLLNLVPARLTALLIWLAAGAPRHWRGFFADANRHRSPNAGWPEAAMARAIDTALAGPRSYGGTLTDDPFVHPVGGRSPGPAEIDSAARILWRSWAIGLGALALSTLI